MVIRFVPSWQFWWSDSGYDKWWSYWFISAIEQHVPWERWNEEGIAKVDVRFSSHVQCSQALLRTAIQSVFFIKSALQSASHDIREFEQRRFWATPVNRKWTFCNVGSWFWTNFLLDRLYQNEDTERPLARARSRKKYGLFCSLHFPQRHKILNLLTLRIEQGYSRDPGFDQNTVRDSGKRKISWRETRLYSYPGSGIRENLSTGCGMFLPVCCEFGKSYVWAANYESTGHILSVVSF